MRKTYLPLSDEDRDYLKALSKKRTIQAQVVDRARILLYKADGMTFQQIADKLAISTATVRLCISKFQKGGLDAALFDVQRPGRPSEITDDAKADSANKIQSAKKELHEKEVQTAEVLKNNVKDLAESISSKILGENITIDNIDYDIVNKVLK